MDKNKEEEHSGGGPPATYQHHTEDMALSLQDKNHSSDLVPLSEERSRPGASSRQSAHGFFGMKIDESSRVCNGDARGKHHDGSKIHMISGGSVENNSTLFNGDLDPQSFKKFFG